MNYTKISKLGFVLASKYRMKVIIQLRFSPMTPKLISKRTGIRIGHISKVLTDLAKEDIVRCVNPKTKKGRIYVITELG